MHFTISTEEKKLFVTILFVKGAVHLNQQTLIFNHIENFSETYELSIMKEGNNK